MLDICLLFEEHIIKGTKNPKISKVERDQTHAFS